MQLTINGIINWITYHIHYQMSAAKTFLYSLLKSRILQNNQQNTVNIVIQEFALYFDTWPGTIQFSCNIIWLHYDFVHCHHKWYQDLLSNVLPKFNRKNNVCNLVTLSYVSKYNPPFVRCYRKTHNLWKLFWINVEPNTYVTANIAPWSGWKEQHSSLCERYNG